MSIPPFHHPPGDPGQPQRPDGIRPLPRSRHDPYPRQPEYHPASKSMAGWALGLSIFNCVGVGALVAIGLAIAVLVKGQRDGRNHGKGMAFAALIISALWIIGFVVFLVLVFLGKIEIDDSERDADGILTGEQEIGPSSLRVGDCLAEEEFGGLGADEDGDVYDVVATPCTRPHSFEVYQSFELDDGDYPGDDEVIRLADTGCFDRFHDFVGAPPARSGLVVTYFFPASSAWRIQGDREVLCLIGEADGSTTGTLEGAKR